MRRGPELATFRWRNLRRLRPVFYGLFALALIRWSKGTFFADTYAIVTRPFWPGPSQMEWIKKATELEQESRLQILEEDNQRLREFLEIQSSSKETHISAPVISRSPNGWWHQIYLGKGLLHGINKGYVVSGPGGLLGIVETVTPVTSRVRLLTSPISRVGVWVSKSKKHGMLHGLGTNRPQLIFLEKNPNVTPGDLVSTSPASTVLPPNIPIGIIQALDLEAMPAPIATVQLISPAAAIDWVQIQKP